MDTDTSSDEDAMISTPPDIAQQAKAATLDLLPKKSKKRYENRYNDFIKWKDDQNINSFSENVVMTYMNLLSETQKPSTLWSHYSMLKTTLSIYHDVDISKYLKVKALLKRKGEGYIPKKSKTLTIQQIQTFINEAPDELYLFTKTALIVGISGACSKHDLHQMKLGDITYLDSTILIVLPNSKTKRTFTITGVFRNILKKYADLRPPDVEQTRFFVNYQKGRCTKQVVGIHKFANVPHVVAKYLKLENPKLYTRYCLR